LADKMEARFELLRNRNEVRLSSFYIRYGRKNLFERALSG
jgi:hypothetical protein